MGLFSKKKFKILHPKGWTKDEVTNNITLYYSSEDQALVDSDVVARISISIYSDKRPLKEVVDENDELRQDLENFALVSDGLARVKDLVASVSVYTYTDPEFDGRQMKVKSVNFVHEGKQYILTLTTDYDKFEEYEPIFDRSIRSIVFE